MVFQNEAFLSSFLSDIRRGIGSERKGESRDEFRLILVGIGNEMRRDDGAGIAVLRQIESVIAGEVPEGGIRKRAEDDILFVYGGEAPEDRVDELISAGPTHVLFFDAADLGLEPGDAAFLPREELERLSTASVSTHKLPLMLTVVLIERDTGARCALVGIQPGDVGFGEGLSAPVATAVERVAQSVLTRLRCESE